QFVQWYTFTKLAATGCWKEFAKQRPRAFDSRLQLFDRLAKGDDKVCALAEYAAYILYRDKGAEVDFVPPDDGLPATPLVVGMLDRAPHPQAARLFVDWAMSNRGKRSTRATRTSSMARCGRTRRRWRQANGCATSSCCFRRTLPTTWRARILTTKNGTRCSACRRRIIRSAGTPP